MNIQPTSQSQSISDDQELAKVLAGVNNQDQAEEAQETTLPEPAVPPTPAPTEPQEDVAEELAQSETPEVSEAPEQSAMPQPTETMPAAPEPTPGVGGDLENIKQEALGELRPLVDKLEVSPEEKFDTYLLLLRSTDDKDLIAPAHDAAKNITDESRRAQALLDIIKEIDFLSGASQNPA